ncbi:MAG TPA: DinB family protein [Candidatus Eisenbacteria bacterium]
MAQTTATEKDMYLQSFQRECETTLKCLKGYPAAKGDFKPHEKSRTAKELAWNFVLEQGMAEAALKGKLDFTQPMPKPPATFGEAVAAFEKSYRETIERVKQAGDADLNRTVQFPVGPGKMGDFRGMDVLWMALQDQIHHRGQFSVYLRMSGAKVPSIYGPSLDEPWM